MQIISKLPHVGTTIFTVMSALAQKHRAINLSQGFPDFSPDEELLRLCSEAMRKGPHQYCPMPGHPLLRDVLSEKIRQWYAFRVNPDAEITITAGATQAIFTAVMALVCPGDEVMYFEPAYDCYDPAIRLAGGKPVPLSLSPENFRPCWSEVRKTINPNTRLLIINNPHNPCSSVLTASDMKELDQIISSYPNLFVLSDEVYEHICFHPEGHQSIWKYPHLQRNGIQVCSFGKTLHATGWKIGYCIAAEPIMQEFRKIHQFNVFCVNHPLQEAIAKYIQTSGTFNQIGRMYKEKRDFFISLLASSEFILHPCEGSYFILADYSAISQESDVEFCRRLTMEYGVAAIPLSVFYSNKTDLKKIRFCFAKKEETLQEAAGKLCRINK